MPHLPLDFPEPFAATFGVMLYPGADEDSNKCAKSAAALITSNAIQAAVLAGRKPCRGTLIESHMLGAHFLPDLGDRYREGSLAGHLAVALFALHNSDPRLASWNNAIKVLGDKRARQHTAFSRAVYRKIKQRFEMVLHLWGAWVLRGATLKPCSALGFDAYDDFQFFLFESECLRQWGQTWKPERSGGGAPPLASNVWRPPASWIPPKRGYLSHPDYPEEVLALLRTAGRPRKAA